MKKIGILVLLLSVLVAAGCSKDDDYSDLNRDVTVDFDPLFAQELQKRGYIADAKKITPKEVKDITQLDVSYGWDSDLQQFVYGELTSLRGIEYFESLTYLVCYQNQLTALDVSKNTALTRLDCRYNQLTTLDVSQNTALTELYCWSNQLTALDVSQNTALTELYCWSNQLTALDVSQNTALTELDCSYNQLTALDVSMNTALTALGCNDNQLTALDVSKNTALTELYCSDNPGSGCVFPVTAWFDNNSIPNSGFTTGLWSYNGKTVQINYLKAGTNPTDITTDFDPLFAQELQKRGYIADAKNVTLEEVKGFTYLNVSGEWNEGTYTYEGKLTSLRGIEYFELLTELDCSGNRLTALDVSKNTALTELNCGYNQLTALDVSGCSALTYLDCQWNQLTALDVSKNTALAYLCCIGNQLTALDVSQNTALTELWCGDYFSGGNQLTALDVSKNTALTELYCGFNQLTTLDVSKNTALTELRCRDNQLTALDVSKNTALTYLDCAWNQLTALDVSKNTALTSLDCSYNPGDGSVFPVTAWFDNNSIPRYPYSGFTTGSWEYNGKTVRIDYRKAK